MIYLDNAATTPMSETALKVYSHVARQYYGNASSLHDPGSSARQIQEASAKTIADTLNARAKDIYFTSGASEANALSILSLLKGTEKKGRHLITTQIEHSSVRNVFNKLEQENYEVTRLPVNDHGEVEIEELKKAIREDTILTSVQHVNSEIGTIQQIAEIGELLHTHGILFHSDCVQSFGKIPLDVRELNADAITFSAHKIYGPKGAGAAWLNPANEWKPVFPDTSGKKEFRSGTSDIPSIAAFAAAAKEMHQGREDEQKRMHQFRDQFLEALTKIGIAFVAEGHPTNHIPNILGLRFPGMEGQFFMLECNQAGLAISTGSACQVGSDRPNITMEATGKTEQESREFIRLSFGKQNELTQIPHIIEKMSSILSKHFEKVNRNRTKETI